MNNISKIGIQCVGCRSCEQSCPKNCIKMSENKEGFIYPIIDEKLCIKLWMLFKCVSNRKERITP